MSDLFENKKPIKWTPPLGYLNELWLPGLLITNFILALVIVIFK